MPNSEFLSYSLQTEMIRNLFPYPLWKRFGTSGSISENFRNTVLEFWNILYLNRKYFAFHFIRNCPGIPLYGTNFRIIPFPKWIFFSGIMETLYMPKLIEIFCITLGNVLVFLDYVSHSSEFTYTAVHAVYNV